MRHSADLPVADGAAIGWDAMAKRKAADVPRELELAGELCLAFVNTAARRPDERYTASDPPPETTAPAFADYGGLVAWARRMGVLEPGHAQRLGRASKRPDETAAVFARAVELRTALGRIFTALARKKKPSSADMGVLNGALAGALTVEFARTGIDLTHGSVRPADP